MMEKFTGAMKVYGDRRWNAPEEFVQVIQRLEGHTKLHFLGPAGIKEVEELLAFFRKTLELLPPPPPKPKKPPKKPP